MGQKVTGRNEQFWGKAGLVKGMQILDLSRYITTEVISLLGWSPGWMIVVTVHPWAGLPDGRINTD